MGWRSDLLQQLPPRLSLPLRARFGFSREPEMKALRHVVGPGAHSIDIGCHLGIYAHRLLALSGPDGSVTGFEPQNELADYLTAAFGTSYGSRFVLHRAALGRFEGEAELSIPREGSRLNRGRASLIGARDGENSTVRVTTLDGVELRRPQAFIKCDVEGFEFDVMVGGRGLLDSDRPVLLVEIEQRHAGKRFQETFALLESLGYQTFVYNDEDDVFVRVPPRTAPVDFAQMVVGRYVYNYFFVHPETASALPELRRRTIQP